MTEYTYILDGQGITSELTLQLIYENGVFIAYSPALDLCGYGYSEKEAKESFHAVVTEYLDYGLSHKTLIADLRSHGWEMR